MPRAPAAALALALALGPAPARGSLDVPVTEARAIRAADLASSSGVARPLDLSARPLGDRAYLEAHQALALRGLVDPFGERLAAQVDARAPEGLHLASLRPTLELRSYLLSGDAERRLLYGRSGDTLEEGLTTFVSASGTAHWDHWLGAAYELRLRLASGDRDYRNQRLYLKADWGRWSLKVGRDAERLGPGYHGSLLLGTDAPTLDLWRIRTEEPLFLPGDLGWLGGMRFSLFSAYLSDPSPEPADSRYGGGGAPAADPRLLGLRASYHPTPWLDLGVSRTTFYGGHGSEAYDTPKDWWGLLSAAAPGGEHAEGDRYVAFDATLRLPALNGAGP
ncbi:MAG: capsule assembly Wzi family protein, partial [Deferrisomatales bacterium]